MTYTITDGNVYYSDDRMTQHIGPASKTETIRIDANTVADVQYAFDLDAGIYIELSRTERTDVLVKELTDAEKIAKLESELAETKQQLTVANDTSLMTMDALAQVYEMVIALQGGGN